MRGRIPYVDSNNPEAWGRCDKTGLPVMHKDLVKQYEYFGNVLGWTGLLVNKKDVDEPNPQLRPPPIIPDPVPLQNPRYFPLPSAPDTPQGLRAVDIRATEVDISWTPVRNATQYAVFWSSPYGEFSTLVSEPPNPYPQPDPPIVDSVYTITGLAPQTTYWIGVASLNNFGKQKGIDGDSIYESYNISSPSYGPQTYAFGANKGPNPYAPLYLTTLI